MSKITELEEKVQELMKEIETLKREEKTEKFEYPFQENEKYWIVSEPGEVKGLKWDNEWYDHPRYAQGHIFTTEQEAKQERDKRALLTQFNQFRDKCNGDWKQDWKSEGNCGECYNIDLVYNDGKAKLEMDWHRCFNPFCLFGYFKEQKDVERAIELFGDEIIRLWVDE